MTIETPSSGEWFSFEGLAVSRKVECGICFDGVVKLYSLKSNKAWFSETTKGCLFLDFFYASSVGIFLREIESPSTWPKTDLVLMDSEQEEKRFVLSSQSSYSSWFVEPKGARSFNLVTAVGPKTYEAYSIKVDGAFDVSQYWP